MTTSAPDLALAIEPVPAIAPGHQLITASEHDLTFQQWQPSDEKQHNSNQLRELHHGQAPSQNSPCQMHRKRERDDDSDGLVENNNNATYGQQELWRQTKLRRSSGVKGQTANGCEQEGWRQMKRPSSSPSGLNDLLEGSQARAKSGRLPSKGRHWNEHELRKAIATAFQSPFPGISAIHPTASVIANSIVIPSVPVHIFKTLQYLLPSSSATAAWKVDFSHPSSSSVPSIQRTRGCLTVTMPTRVHEEFIPFINDIADQLFNAHFLPPRYRRKEIKQSGGTAVPISTGTLSPDAGLAFFDTKKTFLVLEVAYSQKEEDAKRKGQAYILDTNGKIKFVVLVIVTKKLPSTTVSAPSPLQKDDSLSADHDTVHVHVFKAKRLPGGNVTGEKVVDRVQVFPSSAPTDTFTITWSDINCGSWNNFRDAARLLPDTPQPACKINFDNLVAIARSLADQESKDSRESSPLYRAEDIDEAVTPPTQMTKFLESSSPVVRLSSSGGTVSSEQERLLDPDYEPSIGSTESTD